MRNRNRTLQLSWPKLLSRAEDPRQKLASLWRFKHLDRHGLGGGWCSFLSTRCLLWVGEVFGVLMRGATPALHPTLSRQSLKKKSPALADISTTSSQATRNRDCKALTSMTEKSGSFGHWIKNGPKPCLEWFRRLEKPSRRLFSWAAPPAASRLRLGKDAVAFEGPKLLRSKSQHSISERHVPEFENLGSKDRTFPGAPHQAKDLTAGLASKISEVI